MKDYNYYFILVQLILLVPSFYFYKWIIRKTKLTAVNSYAFVCTAIIPVVLVCLFITINKQYIAPWIRSKKFDSNYWVDNYQHRYRMVNDLIDSKILIGKSREEVTSLLGDVAEEGPCYDCIGYSTYDPDQGLFLDHEVLEIDFSKQNRVLSVRLNAW